GELDLATAHLDRPPVGGRLERVPMPPPDVPTARIGELELEAIRGRRAADREAQREALRHRSSERPARDDEAAAALEVVIEPHGGAPAGRALGRDPQLGEAGGDRRPAREVLEIVQNVGVHALRCSLSRGTYTAARSPPSPRQDG